MSSAWQLTLRMPLVKHNQLNPEATTISLIPIDSQQQQKKQQHTSMEILPISFHHFHKALLL